MEAIKPKLLRDLRIGDCISLSGYAADAAEIERIEAVGQCIIIHLCNGNMKSFKPTEFDKLMRCYQI